MQDPIPSSEPTPTPPPSAPQTTQLDTFLWLLEGLRASVFLAPRIGTATPAPFQLLALFVLFSLADIGLSRLEVVGPALFDGRAWLGQWSLTAGFLWLIWWAVRPTQAIGQVASWFVLWWFATLPPTLLSYLQTIATARDWLGFAAISDNAMWALYWLVLAWVLAITARLTQHFVPSAWRVGGLVLGFLALTVITAWQFPERSWGPDYANLPPGVAAPQLELSQETFETQQTLWQEAVESLASSRPGVSEVYGLVYAPYATEDVFLRESTLVAQVLADRFDANRRVLHLVNHATTTDSHPWATNVNLQRGIQALAERMDKDKDVLVVYLTSHGGGDYGLASEHPPLKLQALMPQQLRQALDDAGIRNRVVMVSACYSGGWVQPLASASTLVMTAADATHTSYGCGALSELTYFGRALFDEQLRTTHSFEQAFAQAVPLIKAREIEAKKQDGFSNPQISVGTDIAPVLRALEQRLGVLSANPTPQNK
jgi:hypothetical protein